MKITVRKLGNSAAVRLPVTTLSQLGVAIGDVIEVDVRERAATLCISKTKKRTRRCVLCGAELNQATTAAMASATASMFLLFSAARQIRPVETA